MSGSRSSGGKSGKNSRRGKSRSDVKTAERDLANLSVWQRHRVKLHKDRRRTVVASAEKGALIRRSPYPLSNSELTKPVLPLLAILFER